MNRINNYISDAQQRAKRRKSPWNLLLIPLAILFVGSSWLLSTRLLLYFQNSLMPANPILSSYTRIGAIFMFASPLLPSICFGMAFTNVFVWCFLPFARRVFEKEAVGREYASFKNSTKSLLLAFLISGIIVAPFCLFGVFNYFYVTSEGVLLNPLLSFTERQYSWTDVKEINTRIKAERNNLHLNYILIMNDKTKVDLLEEPRLRFIEAYDQIKPYLEEQNDILFTKSTISKYDINRLRKRYNSNNSEKILNIIDGLQ